LSTTTQTPTESLATQFERDGFLVLKNFVPASFVDRMREVTRRDVETLREPIEFEADVNYPGSPDSLEAPGGQTVRRLRQALSRDPVFQDWVCYPPFVELLIQLVGSPVTCPLAHHNCVMTKQPQFSSDTGWHRDTRFWNFQNGELVNAWLALGQERLENGCLKVIPGSHRMTIGADRLNDKRFLAADHPENQPLFETVQTVELEKGDLLLFHALMFHAATRNYSTETKFSVVFTFHGPENSPIPGSKSASFPELILPTP